jgi:hypothetical protein
MDENIFDLSPEAFQAAIAELRTMGYDTDDLTRQYRSANSPFASINSAADDFQQGLADEGRRSVLGGLLSKVDGSTGMDAIRGLNFEGLGGLLGAGQAVGQAIDAPGAAAQGLIPRGDMAGEAMNVAGMAMGAGGAATAPGGSLRMGLARGGFSEAQRQARDILDMRAAGRAGDVTGDMMARADPQYMYDNTPLPMDEASRLARADAGGFGGDLYHGSNASFDAFNPEALDATGQKIMAHGDGTYLGQQPRMAERYATRRDGGVMYPVRENMGNPWTGDMSVSNLSPEDMATYMSAESGPEALGFSGRRNSLGMSVVPDPSNIRSRFARFDPEFSHLSNLSAANASPAGLLAMQPEQETRPLPFMEMLRGLLR